MHFDKGQLPPVRGFWSLTMYNGEMFFVDNPLNRYTLSPRDPLKINPDGSTDLYIQADSPGVRPRNPTTGSNPPPNDRRPDAAHDWHPTAAADEPGSAAMSTSLISRKPLAASMTARGD